MPEGALQGHRKVSSCHATNGGDSRTEVAAPDHLHHGGDVGRDETFKSREMLEVVGASSASEQQSDQSMSIVSECT